MVPSDYGAAKPDWMFRIGCGLWIVLGWVALRFLGWHIPSWMWWAVVVGVTGMIWEYASILEGQNNIRRNREIEEIKSQLEDIHTVIGYLRQEVRDSRK